MIKESTSEKRPTRAPDPRPARTRAAILNAVERLGSRGDELSVSGVVAEAGLSRSSFYSQFKDLGDIAVQLVRDVDSRLADDAGSVSEPAEAILAQARALLDEFQQRRHLYAAVLGADNPIGGQWEVSSIMAEGIRRNLEGATPADIDAEFASRYIASGYLASIADWLSSENPGPVDKLEVQLRDMLPNWVTTTQK